MSVVGFYSGNNNCVVAYMKNDVVRVFAETTSTCEMPVVVCLSDSDRKRLFGSLGTAASATSNLKSAISQIKRLIGREYKNPVVQDDLKMLPFETSEASDGGILIHLQYLNKKEAYKPVQILVMLFAQLKQMAEEILKVYVDKKLAYKPVQIGIPSYFTDVQRHTYLDDDDACIEGLIPLRLLHDECAVALNFGSSPNDFSHSGPINIVFVDIENYDTQVTVVAFESGSMKILSHHLDDNLGRYHFDNVVYRKIAENVKKDGYFNDVFSMEENEKLMKVPKRNGYAQYKFIECLMVNKDVKGFLKIEYFEKLWSVLLGRISSYCNKAVSEAGLSFDNIHALQLVCFGSHLPYINRMLTRSTFGKEPSSLNKLEDDIFNEEDATVYSTTTLRAADLLPVV